METYNNEHGCRAFISLVDKKNFLQLDLNEFRNSTSRRQYWQSASYNNGPARKYLLGWAWENFSNSKKPPRSCQKDLIIQLMHGENFHGPPDISMKTRPLSVNNKSFSGNVDDCKYHIKAIETFSRDCIAWNLYTIRVSRPIDST